MNQYENNINDIWQKIQNNVTVDQNKISNILNNIFHEMNKGSIAVVSRPESKQDDWTINEWVKKAILLSFRFFPAQKQSDFPLWWDKIPLWNMGETHLQNNKIRIAPGAFVRNGCYLGQSVVVMPSAINMGAWIDSETMIDYGACIGSCAFIGKKCHIAANVTIGGVLEPIQSHPVIIDDNVFIGSGSRVLEGVHIKQGSVLSAGVTLTSSTKIIDRNTGKISQGFIPENSVVVPGTYATGHHGLSIQCAIIIKKKSDDTKKKIDINPTLRQ
jgi:2,3,4,5-tetrahydropyridine-2-carboxylate N-succinyltransferase